MKNMKRKSRPLIRLEQAIRHLVTAPSYVKIVYLSGNSKPEYKGKSPFHTTLSGKTIVDHPNAYGHRTLYHPSTLRVEVGLQWFASVAMGVNLTFSKRNPLLSSKG